jgi:uracil-DNA glycosylase
LILNLKRKEMTYRDLIEKRKLCKECGVCEDLNFKNEKGKLYQLETAAKFPLSMDSLGLWDPLSNSNPLTASILVIGQDFSHVGYLDNLNCLLEVIQKESVNTTNENLIRFIKLIKGIDKEEIYFANAVLCIKSGKMNAPIKRKWLSNCSDNFLKPLIVEHLNNLKIIITLGKVALDAVRIISKDANKVISDFSEKANFSSLPGNSYDINIDGKSLKLYPMFHTGNLGAINASRVDKRPVDLWEKVNLVPKLL